MKRIIEIDEETYDRICNAQSVPDMFGTDIVNGLNTIKNSKAYEDKWIPVSERLPDKDDEYEVTRTEYIPSKPDHHTFDTEGGSYWGLVVDIAKFETRRINDYNNGFDKAYKVIAWRPLPEVYMGDF